MARVPARTWRRKRRVRRRFSIVAVPLDRVERCILLLRGEKVLLDQDLARLFGVSTKRLNEQVRRNPDRFPPDFMFQLSSPEHEFLRSQFATSKASGRGGRRYPPYAFTEHGCVMAANVLNSRQAVMMSVLVVRAFIRLRRILATHKDLARKIAELERRFAAHSAEQDTRIASIYALLDELINPPAPPKKSRIGFRGPDDVD
jgi:hypothetical protein